MANVTQYAFDLLEVGRYLLKQQGVTTGKWTVGFMFNVTGAEAGPSPDKIRPSMVMSVDHFLLTATSTDGPMTIDAAASVSDTVIGKAVSGAPIVAKAQVGPRG